MKKTRMLTITAMLSAMAVILQYLGSVMGLKVGGFLEIEFSDLPAIIGTLSMGPFCGVMIELMKNVIHCFITSTGYVGEFANFCVNGVYVLVLGLIYAGHKTKRRAVVGFAVATVAYSIVGALINYFIMLPLYMPDAPAAIKFNLVMTLITPFNISKGAILAFITLVIYKKLSPIIKGTAR
ncbi:MAG: ECF transporter S component [Clostridia bacterium]|nr:ECF transporter S component [Clostridia bacterium]